MCRLQEQALCSCSTLREVATPLVLPNSNNNHRHLLPPEFYHKNCLSHKNLLPDILSFLMLKFQEHKHPLQCITLASEPSPNPQAIQQASPRLWRGFPPDTGWEDTSGTWKHPASCLRPASRRHHAAGQPGHVGCPLQQGCGGCPWCAVPQHGAAATAGMMPEPSADG